MVTENVVAAYNVPSAPLLAVNGEAWPTRYTVCRLADGSVKAGWLFRPSAMRDEDAAEYGNVGAALTREQHEAQLRELVNALNPDCEPVAA